MTVFAPLPVTVIAPATSANLGPGFDSFGLALDLYDKVEASVLTSGLELDVCGQGAGSVPRDETHLVVRAVRHTFDALGVAQPGLRISCHNLLPHARGLGSSSAAIVAGILLADGLLGGNNLSKAAALELATEIEGHPDNVAACLYGGFTIAWSDDDGVDALSLPTHPDLRPVVFIPAEAVATHTTRRLLPADVGHADAAANAARAALLVAAITDAPQYLLRGTQDYLHQQYRRPAMPQSLALVEEMRGAGIAAVVSGAGPTVLALGTKDDPVDVARWQPTGWRADELTVDARGARLFESRGRE